MNAPPRNIRMNPHESAIKSEIAAQALPWETVIATGLGRRFDLRLAMVAVGLLLIGFIMVGSSSISIAARDLGNPYFYLWRHGAHVTLGLVVGAVAVTLPASAWQRISPALLVAGVVLLAMVLIPGVGREANGSVRWLRIGPVSMQPSELVKLFVILYLAGYLERRLTEVRTTLSGFLKPILVLGVIAVLLLIEPDYGAAVVLIAAALGMFFLGGVPFWTFIAWAGLSAAAMGALVVAAPYRVERLLSFLDPWADPFGSGFQLTQALIAIGRGEWLGVGLGASVQKLSYLPEPHTDFLFAVLAEELGFVGVVVIIAMFAFIGWRAMAIGASAERKRAWYQAYVAYGIGLLITIQAFVNIGVNMGVLPTKGLTLPLMSYGGSSLLVTCLALGILVRVDHEVRMLR